jgi:hypothetical protein
MFSVLSLLICLFDELKLFISKMESFWYDGPYNTSYHMSRTLNNSTSHIWKVLTTQGHSRGWQAEKCVLDPDLTNDMLGQEDMVVLTASVGPCYEIQGSHVGRYLRLQSSGMWFCVVR